MTKYQVFRLLFHYKSPHHLRGSSKRPATSGIPLQPSSNAFERAAHWLIAAFDPDCLCVNIWHSLRHNANRMEALYNVAPTYLRSWILTIRYKLPATKLADV